MRHFIPILFCCILLCACGVQLQVDTYQPAEIELPKGARMRFVIPPGNNDAYELACEMYKGIKESAFFHPLEEPHFYGPVVEVENNTATVLIKNAKQTEDWETRHDASCDGSAACSCSGVEVTGYSLWVEIEVQFNGCTLSDNAYSAHDTSYNEPSLYSKIARKFYQDVMPHPVTHRVRVYPSADNPVLQQAAAACNRGDWKLGASLAERSLKTHPSDAEAHYLLGIIERHNGNFSASDACFRQAFSISPKSRYTAAMRDNIEYAAQEKKALRQLRIPAR